ncbi:MAG: hypothetical protein NE330_17535, partial [Lentisphaeraceae bacterium]|nr:hypothetical protein [Lentisphaeraceae bacterium]
ISWPARVPAKMESTSPFCLSDLYATFAAVTSQELKMGEAPDSVNMLSAILKPGLPIKRPHGLYIVDKRKSELNCLRIGNFKLVWKMKKNKSIEFSELFNLQNDLGEVKNLIENPEYSKVLKDLKFQAAKFIKSNYSRVNYKNKN